MKSNVLLYVLLAVLILSCKKEKDLVKEVPDEIIRVKVDSVLYPRIVEIFPDQSNCVTKLPTLFSDTVQKQIVLTKESEVYVTFIAEGAEYKNTLGWYSYPLGKIPVSSDSLVKNIVFPNISGKGEGGMLEQGFTIQLGTQKFPAGTVIGFFLISNGWEDGSINYGKPTYYTDSKFNTSSNQQHVLFREKSGKTIVLGFEDTSYDAADKDYNDILLNISDNKDGWEDISFDMEKIPVY